MLLAGTDQRELAHNLGISERTLRRALTGKREWQGSELEALPGILGAPEWFFRDGFDAVPRAASSQRPFIPRIPLTLAEQAVDFAFLNEHILERRRVVEEEAVPSVRRMASLIVELDAIPPLVARDRLLGALERSLGGTVSFGYRQARAEIARLRSRTISAYSIPDAGWYAERAERGLSGIRDLVRDRARLAADAVSLAGIRAYLEADADLDREGRYLAVLVAARRVLHNHVLELVGEALNLGRTAGAIKLARPPEFALRSEQLDKRTCSACSGLHGEIVQLGSSEYFDILPPSGCLGGGRCRGLMVYADRIGDVSLPEAA